VSFEIRLFLITTSGAGVTIDKSNGLFSVDDYSFTPDGNCTEATFRCVPKQTTSPIDLFSTVFIQTRPNSSSSFVTKWRGYVVLAGNPRSDKVETYRAVGLKQMFYNTILTRDPVILADDVADMADEVFDGFERAQNRGFSFGGLSGARDIPTLNLQLGDRYTLLESVGDALDALAQFVPSFIVPTGETYTYDGTTYTAGQIVPKVTWGVRGDGGVFFRRLTVDAASVNETDLNVDVQYPALSGEDYLSAPVLVYYPGVDPNIFTQKRLMDPATGEFFPIQPVYHPIHIFPTQNSGPAASQRRIQIPNPDDYLVPITSQIYFADANTTDMLDGDPNTSGQISSGNSAQYLLQTFEAGIVLRLDIEYGNTNGVFFRVDVFRSAFNGTYNVFFDLGPQEVTLRRTFYFPLPLPLQYTSLNNIKFGSTVMQWGVTALWRDGPNGSAGDVEIYDFRPFAVRSFASASAQLALQGLYEIPLVQEVTNLKFYGEEPIRTRIDLTPEVGSAIEVPVERVQYSITTAEGVTTTYHAGQAFDGELVSERVVLEGLARRAVRS
jgi:hypothetical protein